MDKENNLINSYYIFFVILLVAILLIFFIMIGVIIFRNYILKSNLGKMAGKTMLIGALIVLLIIEVFLGILFSNYLRDFNSVQNREFEEITGTVVGYSRTYEANDGTAAYDFNSAPILLDENGCKLKLYVGGQTELNRKYKIIYLKYTKLAEIVEEYSE